VAATAAAPKVAPAKTAATPNTAAVAAPAAPMDRDFIARNQVVERYLSGRLPLKGATEFEQFVHRHPEILDEIGLPERVNAGLRLLEASGKPEPWQEAPRPAWQKPQVTIALAAAVLVLGLALSILTGTSASKSHRIAQLQKQATEQALDPATSTREIRLLPNRSGASNSPAITIGAGGAQLADFKIDVAFALSHLSRDDRSHRSGPRRRHHQPGEGFQRSPAHCAQQHRARPRQLPADHRRAQLARRSGTGLLDHHRHNALSAPCSRAGFTLTRAAS
jgi:hypothetical protein